MSAVSSKAVLLVGGPAKGTRFRPLSLDVPKPLFPIAGRASSWHAIQALSKVEGLVEVVIVGFYDEAVFTPFVKDAQRDFPNLSIRYLREFVALGTAGGLYHFRDVILKGNPEQIFVLHSDIASGFPLAQLKAFHDGHRGVATLMGVKVSAESSTQYGSIVIDTSNGLARHYVEKPENFLSEWVNGGIYLFSSTIFDEIKAAMDAKVKLLADDPTLPADDQLRLEQDVIAPLCAAKKIFVYQSISPWVQIKSAASAIPANSLFLASYKTTNPLLLRRRSPTITAESRAAAAAKTAANRKGPEIVEPCFIDETAIVDPSAKIGPNVSIGANTRVGFGARVKDSILLENVSIEANAVVNYAIVSESCTVGPWARVEGVPVKEGESSRNSAAILAKDVHVNREVAVRSVIVLPNKTISRSAKNDVLL